MGIIDRKAEASGISRRTALRSAVWTATAVTVVVAAPAYAACSGPACPAGTAAGTITRAGGNGGSITTFNTTLTNTGPATFVNPTVVVTWSGGATATYSVGRCLPVLVCVSRGLRQASLLIRPRGARSRWSSTPMPA